MSRRGQNPRTGAPTRERGSARPQISPIPHPRRPAQETRDVVGMRIRRDPSQFTITNCSPHFTKESPVGMLAHIRSCQRCVPEGERERETGFEEGQGVQERESDLLMLYQHPALASCIFRTPWAVGEHREDPSLCSLGVCYWVCMLAMTGFEPPSGKAGKICGFLQHSVLKSTPSPA